MILKLKFMFMPFQKGRNIYNSKIMYDNVNNSLISHSDSNLIFFNLLVSYDGHILKAVGKFIQDWSVP